MSDCLGQIHVNLICSWVGENGSLVVWWESEIRLSTGSLVSDNFNLKQFQN